MLKSIHPLLTADLLHVLRAMGHGDELVVVDSNFPLTSVAATTVRRRPVHLAGANVVEACAAILSVLPVDTFVDQAAWRMEVVGDPAAWPEVQREVQEVLDAAEGRSRPLASLERMAFYEQAKRAFAVVGTSEERSYGCFIFKKGIVLPDGSTA